MDLNSFSFAGISVDPNARAVLFQLSKDRNGASETNLLKIGQGNRVIAKKAFNDNQWLREAVGRKDVNQRQFEVQAHKDKHGQWFIRVRPGFESLTTPDLVGELGDIKGIYRYKNKQGNVIYIGKGIIRDRHNQGYRKRDWEIDLVEYSAIEDQDIMDEAEKYWLEQYKKDKGYLPPLNSQIG